MENLPRLVRKKDNLYWQDSKPNSDGKRPTIPLGHVDDPCAMVTYWELEAQRDSIPGSVNWLLDQFHAAFLDAQPGNQGGRRLKLLAPATKKAYKSYIKPLRRVFGTQQLDELTAQSIVEYLENSESAIAANRQVAVLSRVFTWAIRRGWVHYNPCLRIERNEEHIRNRYIYDHEFVRRKQCAPPKIAVLMDLGYVTALRISDLLRIHLQQPLTSDDSQVWLTDDALYAKPRKTRKKHPMTIRYPRDELLEPIIQTIRQIDKQNRIHGLYLIVNRRGQPYTVDGFESIWKRLQTKDGIADFHFHDIRAKSATDAEAQGINPQVLLGHADPKTTDRYLRGKRIHTTTGPQSKILNTPVEANSAEDKNTIIPFHGLPKKG